MAKLYLVIFMQCFLAKELLAVENEEGLKRESKFLKIIPKGSSSNCFVGLAELEGKVKEAEASLSKVVKHFRTLMVAVSSLSKPTSGTCQGGSSPSNYTFAPDNSADLDNSNNISNKDIFIYSNNVQIVGAGGTSGSTSMPPADTTTTPPTITTAPTTTTPPTTTIPTTTTPTTTTPMTTTTTTPSCSSTSTCYDITSTLAGVAIDVFFGVATTMTQNSASLCAALCLLWGQMFAITSVSIGCYCTNTAITQVCLPASMCSTACPGDPASFCGLLVNPFIVNVYPTSITDLATAKLAFPDGKCYVPILDANMMVFADMFIVTLALTLTPNNCKMECANANFPYSCTYSGTICGCYNTAPQKVYPSQDYCIAPCIGDLSRKCGSLPPTAVPAVSCMPTA